MKCRIVSTSDEQLKALINKYGQAEGLRRFVESEREVTVLPLKGNEDIYKHYDLLNVNGEIKQVDPNTKKTKDWLKTLNLSPNYSFVLRLTPKGYRIFIQNKPNVEGQQLDLLQITSKEERPKLEELDNKIIKFLHRMGITVNKVEDLDLTDKDGNKLNAIAVARLMQKVIEIVENKAKIDTLGEEAAHFLVELMGDNPLVQQMIREISQYDIYQEVLNEYAGIEGYDENILRKEAVGKLIAKILVAKSTDEKLPESNANLLQSFANKVIAFFNYVYSKFSKVKGTELRDLLNPFESAANKILNENVEGLSFDNITKDSPVQMWQQTKEEIEYKEKINKALQEKFVTLDSKTSSYYSTADGRKILHRVTESVKHYYKRIFKTRERGDEDSMKSAHAGIVIHKFMELVFDRRWKNPDEKISHAEILKEVKKQLNEIPDFKVKADDYIEGIVNYKSFTKVIIPTVDGVIQQINKVEERIAKERNFTEEEKAANKATIYSELAVYDKITDTAGTIDLAVVHSNGAISIFDWKSMIFDTVGNVTVSDVQWYKRGAWDIQLATYKRILEKEYGATEFAMSRLVPINIQFDFEGKVKKMQSIFSNENDPHLNLVPSIVERTGYKAIDDKIDQLAKKRNDLLESHLKNRKNKKIIDALDRIDEVIKKLQVKQDVGFIHTQLAAIEEKLVKNEHATSDSPNYLSLEILNEYREFVELFRDFAKTAVEHATKNGDTESIDSLKKISYLIDSITGIINNKTKDAIFAKTGIDITKAAEESGFLGRTFNRLSQFKNPFLQAMSKLVRGNYDQTERNITALYEKIEPITEELRSWASTNGMSMTDAFKKLYNDKTGALYTRISSEYSIDLKKARDTKDAKWFTDNTEVEAIEVGDNIGYRYTGEAKIKYDKARKSLEESLHRKYDGFEDSEKKIKDIMNAWDTRHNIGKNWKKALFSNKNRFIKLRSDVTKYNSAEWNYIQNQKPLKAFYDVYIETMDELDELVEVDINDNFVANIQQTYIDSMLQSGNFGPGALRDRLLQSMQIQQNDQYRGVLGNTESNKSIPLLHYHQLREPLSTKEREAVETAIRNKYKSDDPMLNDYIEQAIKDKEYEKGRKLKSIDLSKTLLLFAESVYMHNAFSATEDMVKAMKSSFANPMQETLSKDTEGKLQEDAFTHSMAKKFGVPKGDADVFDKFMDMYWYGIIGGNQEWSFELFGRKFSGNKAYQNLMQYIALKAMGLKPLLAIGNIIGAKANSFMMATEGREFTKEQFMQTQKRFVSRDKKWGAFAGYFEPHAFSMTQEKARSLSASKLTGWMTMDNMYILHRKGDEMTDNDVLLSMAQNYGIDPKDGVVKKLSQIEDKTVKSLLEVAELTEKGMKIKGLSDEQFKAFRFKVKTIAGRIKGSIPQEDRNLVNSNLYVQSIMMFKNWIPGLAQTRFKKFGKDEFDEFDVGRFSVMFGEFSGTFASKLKAFTNLLAETTLMGFYSGKPNDVITEKYYKRYLGEMRLSDRPGDPNYLSLEEFKQIRAAKLHAMAMELRIFMSLLLMIVGARAMLPDDKDSIGRKTAVIGYRMINRSLLEVSFFIDPRSLSQVSSNAIPQIRLMTDLYKWISNTARIGMDDITGYEPKKSEKTRHRFYRTSKMVPVFSSGADFFDVFDSYNPDSFWRY